MKKLLIYFTAFIFASTAGENPFNKDHMVMFCKNSVALSIPSVASRRAVIMSINDISGTRGTEFAEYFETTQRKVIEHFQNFINLRERVEGKPFHVFHMIRFIPTMSEENSNDSTNQNQRSLIIYATESFRLLGAVTLFTNNLGNSLNCIPLYNTHQYEYYSLAGYFRTSLENVEEYVKGLRNAHYYKNNNQREINHGGIL